jgi:hypothetical protein
MLSFWVNADENKVTSMELAQNWMINGYPDDVGGIYYSDEADTKGLLTIVIVNLSAERENEIRNIVINPNELYFKNGKYSYNELLSVMHKIELDLSEKNGVYEVSIDEQNNRVNVGLDKAVYKNISMKYTKLYGDIVYSNMSSPIHEINRPVYPNVWLLAVLCFVALTVITSFAKRSRKSLTLQTTNGNVISKTMLSSEETIYLVKKSGFIPDDSLFHQLSTKIK